MFPYLIAINACIQIYSHYVSTCIEFILILNFSYTQLKSTHTFSTVYCTIPVNKMNKNCIFWAHLFFNCELAMTFSQYLLIFSLHMWLCTLYKKWNFKKSIWQQFNIYCLSYAQRASIFFLLSLFFLIPLWLGDFFLSFLLPTSPTPQPYYIKLNKCRSYLFGDFFPFFHHHY